MGGPPDEAGTTNATDLATRLPDGGALLLSLEGICRMGPAAVSQRLSIGALPVPPYRASCQMEDAARLNEHAGSNLLPDEAWPLNQLDPAGRVCCLLDQ